MASGLIHFVRSTRTERLKKIHELLPNPTANAFGVTSFVKHNFVRRPPCRHRRAQKAMRGPQRRPARGEGETGHPAPLPRKRSCSHPEQPVGLGWAPSALSSLLVAWLGWKLKPRGSSTVSGCNYLGRTDFLWVPDFQIRESRKPGHPTSPPRPSSPQKESVLSSYTDTNGLSQRRTYPFWSGPPLCQLPALSENKEKESGTRA